MSAFDLVIFNCDGVLVDAEIISARVSSDILKKAGVTISLDEYVERFSGLTFRDILLLIEKDSDIPLQASLLDTVEARIDNRLQKEAKAIDGAAQAVLSIPYKKCVCSNSSQQRIEMMLNRARLLPLFEGHIISASDIPTAKPKPSPDVFLYASEKMSADPSKTIVIEDTVHGVTGAVAAGMRVIGFTGGSHTFPRHAELLMDAGAETTVNRMMDIKPTVEALSIWDGKI